jgi:hypothetical protein
MAWSTKEGMVKGTNMDVVRKWTRPDLLSQRGNPIDSQTRRVLSLGALQGEAAQDKESPQA